MYWLIPLPKNLESTGISQRSENMYKVTFKIGNSDSQTYGVFPDYDTASSVARGIRKMGVMLQKDVICTIQTEDNP